MRNKDLFLSGIMLFMFAVALSIPDTGTSMLAMNVLSVAASSSGSVVIPFTPQYLGVLPGAAGTITTIQAKTLGIGVTCDLDATGLLIMGRPRVMAPFIGANRMNLIPMADGLLKDRTCQVDLVTGAGGTVNIFAVALREGKYAYVTGRQTLLANTGYQIDAFFQVGGDFATTDNITITSNPLLTYEKSITHQITFNELRALAVLYSCMSTGSDWDQAVLDNWNQNWKALSVIPVANRTMYFTKLAA